MKISELYEKYHVSPNLKEHMFNVAAVALFIENHWIGTEIDKTILVKCALVHDIGNIVKFDLDGYPELLGSDIKNIDIWKERQKEMILKYGKDDNKTTNRILEEIRFPQELIKLIYLKRFVNSIETANSNNYVLKILYYSDLRVLPLGIGSLEERMEEIRTREQYKHIKNLNELFDACRILEKQIQSKTDVPLSQINSDTIKYSEHDFLYTEV
jgi:hypothetical protein